LHHTGSGRGVSGDVATWKFTKTRVATCVIVAFGVVNQLFSSRFWGYHLGLKPEVFAKFNLPYRALDKACIGVEIDAWGGLKKIDGQWRAWPNDYGTTGVPTIVQEKEVQEYRDGYRGFYGFHKYLPEDLAAVKQLLLHWNQKDGICLEYNNDIWDLSERALRGCNGVFTHGSYNTEKSDVHPQPELIEMLKSLTND